MSFFSITLQPRTVWFFAVTIIRDAFGIFVHATMCQID